ncbi:ABC-type dipeptide/oligopeptide/nickel transport system permease component [Paenibacillus sp. 4624]|jgi:ABC-type dipeptide/oligopeptide/nickel transport system permease component|uniref:Signal transduction histidine kinase n=1 Tax=Paenibacillus amylolyticus TaxID=1451 RepID=A0A5M9WS05_PAEAM|nr:hypothetical protein [Paenibacillus amylolyticus]KAA8784424.1 hypothetical protein EC604_11260 [Paenibacillus amylolyticus]
MQLDSGNVVIFIILAFALGLALILGRNSVPDRLRRGMALIATLLVCFAFFLIVYYLYNMGA